ncbi:hypothetical protein, partial [Caballeronia sp. M23-90]
LGLWRCARATTPTAATASAHAVRWPFELGETFAADFRTQSLTSRLLIAQKTVFDPHVIPDGFFVLRFTVGPTTRA